MANKIYSVTDERKKEFAALFVLEHMVNDETNYPILLEGNDRDLTSILEWLLIKGYVAIQNKQIYAPTPTGTKVVEEFGQRYQNYLEKFDIFCAVDLSSGEYAFDSYYEFDGDDDWAEFLSQDRWEDLRVAIAEYKKWDPIEIVFMSFIQEERFGRDQNGWQFDLLLGKVWDEIVEIVNSSVHFEELSYEDEYGPISAESVIKDILTKGENILEKLQRQEQTAFEASYTTKNNSNFFRP